MICDIDGNGHLDIVGFSSNSVNVSFNDGTNLADPVSISTDFNPTSGYVD